MKAEKEKKVKKKAEKKVMVIEYFTDEMHKKIFPFQEGMKATKSFKPLTTPIKFSFSK